MSEDLPLAASHAGLALVTGAAHRVGKAIALALAQKGYAIGLHYHRSESDARQTAAELQAFSPAVFLLQADLTQEQEVERLFQQVSELPHRLEVLVNSAGQMQSGDLMTLTGEAWDAALAINLKAPWLCARNAAVLMKPHGGLIVNITDAGSSRPWTGYPAYIISKNGLEMLTRLLAKRLAPEIRVNAVAPGLILPSPDLSPQKWDRLVQRVPLERTGSLAEIAAAVLFLLENKYMTGQTVVVDGGYQLV